MIIAITGSRGKGKSFILEKIAKSLRSKTTSLGGVISRSIVRGENHHEYELLCVGSGRSLPLATPCQNTGTSSSGSTIRFGAYRFFTESLQLGNRTISEDLGKNCLFIDEVGRWEMEGGGWSRNLDAIRNRKPPTLIGIRRGLVQIVSYKWKLDISSIFDLDTMNFQYVANEILKKLDETPITKN